MLYFLSVLPIVTPFPTSVKGISFLSYSKIKNPGDFLDALEHEIVDEAKATREHCEKNWKNSAAARIKKGVCLGVRINNDSYSHNCLVVHCDANESRFREADILRLNRGIPSEFDRWDLTLVQDWETKLVLSAGNAPIDYDLIRQNADGWYLDESYLDMSWYYLKAIDHVKNTGLGQDRVLPFLMGNIPLKITPAREDNAVDLARSFGLNESQEEALVNANIFDVSYLIQGPPGTGKTMLLALLTKLVHLEHPKPHWSALERGL